MTTATIDKGLVHASGRAMSGSAWPDMKAAPQHASFPPPVCAERKGDGDGDDGGGIDGRRYGSAVFGGYGFCE